jgi:hypothetical protein
LADDRTIPIKPSQSKLSLAGLGAAFGYLRQETGRDSYFAGAQAACGRGLKLIDLDPTARGYFEKYTKASPPPTIADMEKDLQILRAAVIEASYETAPENDPPFFEGLIGDPESYRFTMLGSVLSGQEDRPTVSVQPPRRLR